MQKGLTRKWIEKYIHTSDATKIFARNEKGVEYYAENDDGDQFYPVIDGASTVISTDGEYKYATNRFGDQFYPLDSTGHEKKLKRFAKDRNGIPFYPKFADGDEYVLDETYIVKDGDVYYTVFKYFVDEMPKNPIVVYPYDKNGKPIYQKNTLYVSLLGYHIATDREGNPVYAQKEDKDGHLNDVYPEDQTYALLKDGITPKYARNYLGNVIFIRVNGRERYLQRGRTEDDYIEGVDRYARGGFGGSEIYPKIKANSNGDLYEALIGNRYALNQDKKYYYPLDVFDNEYYISWSDPSLDEKDVLIHRYALSATGYYIVPKKKNNPYISKAINPLIRQDNIVAMIDRGFDDVQDYLTDVSGNIKPSQLRNWKEKYIRTHDKMGIFAKNKNGNPYYARDVGGNELYPIIGDEPVFLRFPNGRQKYPIDAYGNEIYYKYPKHTGKENTLFLLYGDQYATLKNYDQYYPSVNGKELMLSGIYAQLRNGTLFYPKNEFGDEYIDPPGYYIYREKRLIYPLTKEGNPIYPTLEGTEYYFRQNNRYHIGVDKNGDAVYAQHKNHKGQLNDFYPPDQSYGYLRDRVTPKYAKNYQGKVIFVIDRDGREVYLKHKETLDDFTEGVDRYARHLIKEIYPLKIHRKGQTVHMYESLLHNQYAQRDPYFGYYPLDCFGNQYYISWTPGLNEEDVILEGRYALSAEGYAILPQKNNTEYISDSAIPPVRQDRDIKKVKLCFDVSQENYSTRTFAGYVPRKMRPYKVDPPRDSESSSDENSKEDMDPVERNPKEDMNPMERNPKEDMDPFERNPNENTDPTEKDPKISHVKPNCDRKDEKKSTPFYKLWYVWCLFASIVSAMILGYLIWIEKISLKSLTGNLFKNLNLF